MEHVLIINGPNLNLLGTREPGIYGSTTLSELEGLVRGWGEELGFDVEAYQSNHEGAIIDRIHAARDRAAGIVINPGALTHYSYAIHDAIAAVDIPTVEVHLSNVMAREEWRRQSVISPACVYTIYGRGKWGYRHALAHLRHRALMVFTPLQYGASPDQVGDLRIPGGAGPHPVAVLLHGGFWRDPWKRDIMEAAAVDLVERGWATWNLEYRRVGTAGGWPATLEDVAAGINHLADIATDHRLDPARVTLIGHSAGAQLALWAIATTRLSADAPRLESRVTPRSIVMLAPITDLATAYELDLGSGAVAEFLGCRPDDGAERYRAVSPLGLLPIEAPLAVIHGVADQQVPATMSRRFAAAGTATGTAITYRELPGADHFDLIDPGSDAWTAVMEILERL